MRLPYEPTTPPPTSPASTSEIYTRIAARRSPRPLIPLDLALLHSPPIADGWNSLLGAIRSQTVLSPALLELAVCRIAVLNKASWEWIAHAPLAVKAGVSKEVLGVVRVLGREAFDGDGGAGRQDGEQGLTSIQWAVLAYTDAMTVHVEVPEKVFAALGECGLGEREVVELTATVAAYNCVSRLLVALDVGENNGREMVVPE